MLKYALSAIALILYYNIQSSCKDADMDHTVAEPEVQLELHAHEQMQSRGRVPSQLHCHPCYDGRARRADATDWQLS